MSTSRLSYTSGVESDGEFFGPETPRASRTTLTGPISLTSAVSTGALHRSNSDPSLAADQPDAGVQPQAVENGSRIPDYNAPPPYAVSPSKDDGVNKRYATAADYGFANGNNDHRLSSSRRSSSNQPRGGSEALDDLPLPPPPQSQGNQKSSTSSSSSSRSPKVPPPKIDRLKKPSRRSATERLFQNDNGSVEINGNNGGHGKGSSASGSLDRNAHIRDMKMVRLI
jgi:hypothetical protein